MAELTGRALDEAAAIAMGWVLHPCGWQDQHGMLHNREPQFSTDPALLLEMLAWLSTDGYPWMAWQGATAGWQVGWTKHTSADVDTITGALSFCVAIARLVVAVSEVRRG